MINNVFFYCPSKKIGGEQQLYIRCANYLISHSNVQVHYIDYSNGYAQDHLSEGVKRIDSGELSNFEFPSDSLLIIALSYANTIFDIFKLNEKPIGFRLLYWSLQPYNLTGKILIHNKYNLLLPFQKLAFRKTIESLCSDGVIRFMDYNNYHTVKKVFGLEMDHINYLPVPINDDNIRPIHNLSYNRIHDDNFTFLWISRIDHAKKNTLLTIINELENVNKRIPCKLFVVGDGDVLDEVKQFASMKSIEVVFMGRLFGHELDSFIDNEIDIGVGMGISGLEISKRGKPVIMKAVMPKKRKAGVEKDYIFLHQEYGYSLGSPDFYIDGQSDFLSKVKELQHNYLYYAKKDYEYTVQKHSIVNTGKLLLKVINSGEMSDEIFSEVKKLEGLIKTYRRITLRKNGI